MPEAPANANWYTYFPEDYRWSAAICGMISWAKWRGSEIGEIDQVGRRLAKKIGDDRHWFREWSRMGDRLRTLGRAEERKGHGLSAASHYQRACCYYQMGERFRTPKDKKALDSYRKALDCFARFARLAVFVAIFLWPGAAPIYDFLAAPLMKALKNSQPGRVLYSHLISLFAGSTSRILELGVGAVTVCQPLSKMRIFPLSNRVAANG